PPSPGPLGLARKGVRRQVAWPDGPFPPARRGVHHTQAESPAGVQDSAVVGVADGAAFGHLQAGPGALHHRRGLIAGRGWPHGPAVPGAVIVFGGAIRPLLALIHWRHLLSPL